MELDRSKLDLNLIKLDKLENNIFSTIAEAAAGYITSKAGKDKNKFTQLRKFYDELVMWHDRVFRVSNRDSEYQKAAPFIQILKAKAAYSQGRGHVDKNFTDVFNRIIGQIHTPDTLKNAKLFFEAVLGYRKAAEQK